MRVGGTNANRWHGALKRGGFQAFNRDLGFCTILPRGIAGSIQALEEQVQMAGSREEYSTYGWLVRSDKRQYR